MNLNTILKNQLLIAMPVLNDPYFAKSVTYICEHNENGAIGIIINLPMSENFSYIFEQMDITVKDQKLAQRTLLVGGPVQQDRGFVIHRPQGQWRSSLHLTDEISITTSKDVLLSLAAGEGPQDAIVALGYAGWEANQLEQEIANNSWLTTPVNSEILFEVPYHKRWEAAAAEIGIDMNRLSSDIGHA